MAAQIVRTMKVSGYSDFLDQIPTSGMFDMQDCTVEVWCPEESDVMEVQKMVHLVESMVNVTDVVVGSRIEDLTSDQYSVVIKEITKDILRKQYSRGE